MNKKICIICNVQLMFKICMIKRKGNTNYAYRFLKQRDTLDCQKEKYEDFPGSSKPYFACKRNICFTAVNLIQYF